MPGPPPDAAAASVPTVHVEGGGGAGGGGGGKKGKKGKGKKGAKKGKGKQGPGGGKKKAKGGKGSGSGKGGKCPKCSKSQSRGDPIDVVTGRAFTVPFEDLFLPGPLALSFERTYGSSIRDRDGPLGFGWAFTYGAAVELHRSFVQLWTEDGTSRELPRPAPGGEVIGEEGLLLRLSTPDELSIQDVGGETSIFQRRPTGKDVFRLAAVEDPNGNRIALSYDANDRLVQLTDSVGRTVRLDLDGAGRIAALRVDLRNGQWHAAASYTYDGAGNLASMTDADGHCWTYLYDDRHLLVEQADPTGLTFHYVYDAQDRCIETWGDYPGRVDPSISPRAPKVLADGRRVRGIQHVRVQYFPDGYSEVVTPAGLERFEGNDLGLVERLTNAGGTTTREFDDNGHVLSLVDALGARTTFVRDARGRLLELTDALGFVQSIQRDANGRITELRDEAGSVWRAWYDRFGNVEVAQDPLGGTNGYKYDSRGLLVESTDSKGATSRFRHDADGNLVELIESDGAVWAASYDVLGRQLSTTDPAGNTQRFSYSPRGDLLSVTEPSGAVRHYRYDGVGNLLASTDPDGMTVRLRYGGYHWLCGVDKPNGTSFELRYDLEGEVLDVYNERGEQHLYEYTALGFLAWQRHFDGREQSYRWDAMGRLVWHRNAGQLITEFAYDLEGQLVERRYADGSAESFAWSPTGMMVGAKSDLGEWTFERDACDRMVREKHLFGGVTDVVEKAFDLTGDRVGTATSRGHRKLLQRDGAGTVRRVTLDGLDFDLRTDLLGRETSRALGRGGALESEFDAAGHLTRRRVRSPSSVHRPVGPEPDWIGPRRAQGSYEIAFQYALTEQLVATWDQVRGLTQYQHDIVGNLIAAVPQGAAAELFHFDERDNLHEAGPGAPVRVYGAGNRLLRKGTREYEWDPSGQLARRSDPLPDGSVAVWEYEWSAKGTLAAAVAPDGTRTEFAYDPFFRRIAKRSVKPDGSIAHTRFVWDGDVLVHEVCQAAAAAGDPVVEIRTYCFADESFEPWAHTSSRGEHAAGVSEWFHYVTDNVGAPVALVDGAGDLACLLDRKAWGETRVVGDARTTTPLRFLGQYEDGETGLAYNRFRYYDPDSATWLSADPMNLTAGNNEYAYMPSPGDWLDPWGLGVADKLGRNMKKDGHPCRPGETPHHIVQREGSTKQHKRARAILKRNGIDIDDADNGARLKGTAKTQRKTGGHDKGCKGYHAGKDIHGEAAMKKVADRLEGAEAGVKRTKKDTDATFKAKQEAAVRKELRKIRGEMETRKPGNR